MTLINPLLKQNQSAGTDSTQQKGTNNEISTQQETQNCIFTVSADGKTAKKEIYNSYGELDAVITYENRNGDTEFTDDEIIRTTKFTRNEDDVIIDTTNYDENGNITMQSTTRTKKSDLAEQIRKGCKNLAEWLDKLRSKEQ